jgi:hypothetical protein
MERRNYLAGQPATCADRLLAFTGLRNSDEALASVASGLESLDYVIAADCIYYEVR